MAEIIVSVSPHERVGLLASTIWCLVRSRAFGGPGDAFRLGETWFVITGTEIMPWVHIRDEYYRECGFGSSQEFQDRYSTEITRGQVFDPSTSKVIHWIGRLPYSGDRLPLEVGQSGPEREGGSKPPVIVPGWPFWVKNSRPIAQPGRPMIWNDPERLGMDALAYCMGIQCPLKNRCKRNISEAAKNPHEAQVKLLPTTPYNKVKGDCDYFIKK